MENPRTVLGMETVRPATSAEKVAADRFSKGAPMKKTCDKQLARFLRDLRAETDTSKTTILSLSALKTSLGSLNDPETAFEPQLRDMIRQVRQSRPELPPLHHLLDFFELDMAADLNAQAGGTVRKERAAWYLEQRICQAERTRDALADQVGNHVAGGDRLLVCQPGDALTAALAAAGTRDGKRIRVMLPDLHPERTRRMASEFSRAGLALEPVPPADLDRCLAAARKLFLGPAVVAGDGRLVADARTADLVRRCRQKGIPVFLFTDTLHYAPDRALSQRMFAAGSGGDDREIAAAARDLVSLAQVDHIVTELGEVSTTGTLLCGLAGEVPADPDACREFIPPQPGGSENCPELVPA